MLRNLYWMDSPYWTLGTKNSCYSCFCILDSLLCNNLTETHYKTCKAIVHFLCHIFYQVWSNWKGRNSVYCTWSKKKSNLACTSQWYHAHSSSKHTSNSTNFFSHRLKYCSKLHTFMNTWMHSFQIGGQFPFSGPRLWQGAADPWQVF